MIERRGDIDGVSERVSRAREGERVVAEGRGRYIHIICLRASGRHAREAMSGVETQDAARRGTSDAGR